LRKAFIQSLIEIAGLDERVMLITGDLGYMVIEEFAGKFPGRFLNAGVAEQNMVGIATGLAEAGYIPFVYSIVNFSALRPYEVFRNGPVIHRLPVRLIGVGGGLEYSNNGATHYGLEDIGIMRVQNGLQIIAPADSQQTRSALLATWDLPGPIYYRLGKDENVLVPGLDGRFDLHSVQLVRRGNDVLFLTLGNIAGEALEAAQDLAARGIETTVAVVPSLNPGPVDDLIRLLRDFPLALTVEAHFINGGLGSLISEVIAENSIATRLVRCGIRTVPDGITGSQKFLYRKFLISGDALANQAVQELHKLRSGHEN
jgi:transketolase